jgi:SAM-dependent methyltransferase
LAIDDPKRAGEIVELIGDRRNFGVGSGGLYSFLMNYYSHETYGERVAGVYDEWHSDYDPSAIDMLAEFAGGGKALELGIGTGRIALPLSARGIEIHGIDAAASMISRLHSKPGSERLTVIQGDFAEFQIQQEFALVYVVFNTFFALPSQEAQVQCFRNVAAHLSDDGCFLIEAFVPDLTRFKGGQVNWATKVTSDVVELDVGQHDPLTQRVVSQKVVITDGSVRLYPVQIRYVWPAELDLMAQLAGLRLRERWSSWKREPFTSQSTKHVSVYQF